MLSSVEKCGDEDRKKASVSLLLLAWVEWMWSRTKHKEKKQPQCMKEQE